MTFSHWSGVTPYTSSYEFAGSCVFDKQSPGVLSLRPLSRTARERRHYADLTQATPNKAIAFAETRRHYADSRRNRSCVSLRLFCVFCGQRQDDILRASAFVLRNSALLCCAQERQDLSRSYVRFFAEFLGKDSPVRLSLLDSPPCFGFRYGFRISFPAKAGLRSFSWKTALLNLFRYKRNISFALGISLAGAGGFSCLRSLRQ